MSIADLRNRLKPVPVATLEAEDQALNKALGKADRGDNDLIKFVDGTNLFRIYPPHEQKDVHGRNNPFAEPVVVTYVPAYVIERDDKGNALKDDRGEIKKKLSRKPVFNASIHGKKDKAGNPLTKDLVDEFVRIAIETSKTKETKEQKDEYLTPIFGFFSKDPNKRIDGITYSPKWTTYVHLIEGGVPSRFGRIEFGKAVKERINKIAAIETDNTPLGTDPFTDLDEGRALKIIYDSKATQSTDYYTTEIDNATVPEVLGDGRKVNVTRLIPITDDMLEVFAKATPLTELYREVFTRRDFDTQLLGLKLLDEKYKMGIFDSSEFQIIAEEIAKHYPVEEDKAPTSTDTTNHSPVEDEPLTIEKAVLAPVEGPAANTAQQRVEETDMFSTMSREELKTYSEEAGTGILIKPVSVMSDEDLRDELRIWRLENQEQFEALIEKKEEPAPTPAPVAEKPPLSARERLEALKNKGA